MLVLKEKSEAEFAEPSSDRAGIELGTGEVRFVRLWSNERPANMGDEIEAPSWKLRKRGV